MIKTYPLVDDKMVVDIQVTTLVASKLTLATLRKAYDSAAAGKSDAAIGFWDALQTNLSVATGRKNWT